MEKNNDIVFGLNEEDKVFETLKNNFDINLKKSKKKYSRYDFYSDKILIELKSRRNKINDYTSTMIGFDKLEFAELNSHKDFYFVFNFTDGLYYWKYDRKLFDDGLIETKNSGRCDRGYNEYKLYAYIDNKFLKKI